MVLWYSPYLGGFFHFPPLGGDCPRNAGEVQTQLTPIQIIDRFIVLFSLVYMLVTYSFYYIGI